MKRKLIITIITQSIVIISGFIKTLVLPNIFATVEDYGYWQIFMFYTSYLLIFTLGYHEGIYLVYGGEKLKSLPDGILEKSNGFHLILMSLITLIGIGIITISTAADSYKRFIYIMVLVKLAPSAVNEIFSRIFQTTNEFKKYSIFTLIDKIAFLVFMLLMIITNNQEYKLFVIADVILQYIHSNIAQIQSIHIVLK